MTHRPDLPFGIDRTSGDGLVDQLADSIRAAVRKGKIKEGDVLPGFREIADSLGVSLRVPRDAVKRLSAEGVLIARRGVGTVVCGAGIRGLGKRILILQQETGGGYYDNVLVEILTMRLLAEGHLVVRIPVPFVSRGRRALEDVRNALGRERIDCAFAMLQEDDYFSLLAEFGIPYVACTLRPTKQLGADFQVLFSCRTCEDRFAAHCARKRVKRVLQLTQVPDALDITRSFAGKGIRVETLVIPVKSWDEDNLEVLQRETMRLFDAWLTRNDLPDVVFFGDDFVARAGLVVLSERRIRYPEDVGVVVWSNRGNGVIAAKSLTRMDMDVRRHAKILSEAFARYVRGDRFPRGIVLGPTYMLGESFR